MDNLIDEGYTLPASLEAVLASLSDKDHSLYLRKNLAAISTMLLTNDIPGLPDGKKLEWAEILARLRSDLAVIAASKE
ncbi:MAG: hypothetical protein K2H87_05170 [Duncaniella sp.]|nr:hypothetical protein [Duncaniella sp.]